MVKSAVLSSSAYEVPKTLALPITHLHVSTKLYTSAFISFGGPEFGTSTVSKCCPLSQGEDFKGAQLKIRQLENEVVSFVLTMCFFLTYSVCILHFFGFQTCCYAKSVLLMMSFQSLTIQ